MSVRVGRDALWRVLHVQAIVDESRTIESVSIEYDDSGWYH
jgi:hypothetical protein